MAGTRRISTGDFYGCLLTCQCPVFGPTRRWHQAAFQNPPAPTLDRPAVPKEFLQKTQVRRPLRSPRPPLFLSVQYLKFQTFLLVS